MEVILEVLLVLSVKKDLTVYHKVLVVLKRQC